MSKNICMNVLYKLFSQTFLTNSKQKKHTEIVFLFCLTDEGIWNVDQIEGTKWLLYVRKLLKQMMMLTIMAISCKQIVVQRLLFVTYSFLQYVVLRIRWCQHWYTPYLHSRDTSFSICFKRFLPRPGTVAVPDFA